MCRHRKITSFSKGGVSIGFYILSTGTRNRNVSWLVMVSFLVISEQNIYQWASIKFDNLQWLAQYSVTQMLPKFSFIAHKTRIYTK